MVQINNFVCGMCMFEDEPVFSMLAPTLACCRQVPGAAWQPLVPQLFAQLAHPTAEQRSGR
jgi:hypothetical protein